MPRQVLSSSLDSLRYFVSDSTAKLSSSPAVAESAAKETNNHLKKKAPLLCEHNEAGQRQGITQRNQGSPKAAYDPGHCIRPQRHSAREPSRRTPPASICLQAARGTRLPRPAQGRRSIARVDVGACCSSCIRDGSGCPSDSICPLLPTSIGPKKDNAC